MTSNPKPIVTIVLPERRSTIITRPARVFVGDVELPVKSVYVDLYNGDVDLTLHPEEVRIVREAPAPAAEPAETSARARKTAGIAGSMSWLGAFFLLVSFACRGFAVEREPGLGRRAGRARIAAIADDQDAAPIRGERAHAVAAVHHGRDLDRPLVPRDHDLRRVVVIGGLHDLVLSEEPVRAEVFEQMRTWRDAWVTPHSRTRAVDHCKKD